ncbi:D-alanyl-D-alanine carboxypeptidase/D-alanyl-D-alanine-endopeptidase [Sediminicola sp. 1XM1-17]|uniref:D-alanyl-D-alanine carboxypeptidase/D-alanyl-D-alanine-endopeptidase n=1 Tax=Sediminicola sp. 1XM1-17 TaxID=3127702 RepID=UPI0030787FFC
MLTLLISVLLIGCSASKQRKLTKGIVNSITIGDFENQFTGFLVFDPTTKDTIISYNSDKYFLPASNVKIFTLYTALQLLPNSIPSLKYIEQGDTLYIEGTGDPTPLHPYYKDSTLLHFLAKSKAIALHPNNFKEDRLGPGWSWEDYDQYYAPERGALPLYGNVVRVIQTDRIGIVPDLFRDSVLVSAGNRNRQLHQNLFYLDRGRKDTVEVPFITDSQLTKKLLEKALNKEIGLIEAMPKGTKKVLYGLPSDSLYRRMMHHSDNFIAEQLLILSSSVLKDTLNSKIPRDHILKNQLSSLRQAPRWVDGSGLSRYNLFTPESMVVVLEKLYEDLPKERLLDLFPAGGMDGTIQDWFRGNPKPYLFAKSGSMGNTYCLSGYLRTGSGKILIFSFMNNHYRQSTNNLKKEMTAIFESIRDAY